ncbi:MAG: 2-oxoglutarate dehydrogenase E1 component [Calditrichaeota bacterium]|nr:2-oxoglutarate dehydrogenase E1 component [Calditrichota bacterium]
MKKQTHIHHAHPRFIDSLYQEYLKDPDSVESSWRTFFEGFEFALSEDGHKTGEEEAPVHIQKEMRVLNLIQAYRSRGHLFTRTNPVRTRRQYRPTLDLVNFNLEEEDLDITFQAGLEIGIGPAPLREIVEHLTQTYCHSIGAEFMFIREPARVWWLRTKMESSRNTPQFTLEEKRHILQKLNQAVVFENFLHTKYIGQKRFSLQGGETLIPGLDAIIEKGSEMGIEEFVIGMPHRGRLNVLANILNKSYEEIFSEFEGEEYAESVFAGDVKYHLGYTSRVKTQKGKKIQLTVAPNPSHLEAVDPVVQGIARAKMEMLYGNDYTRVAPILIHGDAAMAGQGVVYEVIQMSQLPAYHTGGTIHLVINNQLGFTTNYLEGRSSTYCTDVAKVTLSPVFHVNADDVEAVVFAIQLAMEYRQIFHTDVFIDLLGYRKYGHNEGDEPRFTQPKLYKIIAEHPDPREIYIRKLMQSDSVDKGLGKEMEREFLEMLQERLEQSKKKKSVSENNRVMDKCDESQRVDAFDFEEKLKTAIDRKKLLEIGDKILTIPKEEKIFRKIRKLYDGQRKKLIDEGVADWAIGEYLAYGTLLAEDISVRISGQDTVRGTFSHRHAVLLNEETEEPYIPLQQVQTKNSRFDIYNTLLSEYAALGFEYGYSCNTPQTLTIWEAQFGDFVNGAQVVIDQFISSAEQKWKRMNGLVMYLPHGYEGQGPEHSSARIERFLELCAKNNMVLANCTTPANFFHLLRRHMKIPFRTPLIVFTSKSLLRHPRCISPVEDFVQGHFEPVLDDESVKVSEVKKVIFCSGKIYYDLLEHREANELKNAALIRLEQIYPLPVKTLKKIIRKYNNAEKHLWVQEEPENFGILSFLKRKFDLVELEYIAREESATPATGFHRQHVIDQKKILTKALGD